MWGLAFGAGAGAKPKVTKRCTKWPQNVTVFVTNHKLFPKMFPKTALIWKQSGTLTPHVSKNVSKNGSDLETIRQVTQRDAKRDENGENRHQNRPKGL